MSSATVARGTFDAAATVPSPACTPDTRSTAAARAVSRARRSSPSLPGDGLRVDWLRVHWPRQAAKGTETGSFKGRGRGCGSRPSRTGFERCSNGRASTRRGSSRIPSGTQWQRRCSRMGSTSKAVRDWLGHQQVTTTALYLHRRMRGSGGRRASCGWCEPCLCRTPRSQTLKGVARQSDCSCSAPCKI